MLSLDLNDFETTHRCFPSYQLIKNEDIMFVLGDEHLREDWFRGTYYQFCDCWGYTSTLESFYDHVHSLSPSDGAYIHFIDLRLIAKHWGINESIIRMKIRVGNCPEYSSNIIIAAKLLKEEPGYI